MGGRVIIRVTKDKVPKLLDGIQPQSNLVTFQLANDIKEEARRLVPVDTGALQRSIRVVTEKDMQEFKVIAGGGSEDVNYASYVEFGTRFMAPRAYMSQAQVNVLGKFNARHAYGNAIAKAIDRGGNVNIPISESE